jgi:hypothetical protein
MVARLLTTKIVKKRTKHFKMAHIDRYIGLKVSPKAQTVLFLPFTLKLVAGAPS